jgi:predicted transposase YdaD
MKITNPHDKYFKEVFSNTDEAIAFLKGSLPQEPIL